MSDPEATFPVGLRVGGRLAVVVGGGGLAARVTARLLAAGARVRVVAPEPADVIAELGRKGLLEVLDRDYRPGDLDGAALVLACSDRGEVNARAAADAERLNIWSAGPEPGQTAAALLPEPVRPGQGLAGPGPAEPGLPGAGVRVLVLGGARSGKSVLAESMLADAGVVDYVATSARAGGGDSEWDERISEHQARRPPGWRTLETTEVAAVLSEPAAGTPVLVDCLATWLARVMDDTGVWTDAPGADKSFRQRLDELVTAWNRTCRPVIVVSNEVGSGVVPATVSGRLFRDELGRLNATLAAGAEQVWLCTAGIGQRLR